MNKSVDSGCLSFGDHQDFAVEDVADYDAADEDDENFAVEDAADYDAADDDDDEAGFCIEV